MTKIPSNKPAPRNFLYKSAARGSDLLMPSNRRRFRAAVRIACAESRS